MPRRIVARISSLIACVFALTLGQRAPVSTQSIPIDGLVTTGASSALIDTLKSHKTHIDVAPPAGTASPAPGEAPLPPVSDADQTKAQFLPPTVDYQLKIGTNFAAGPTSSIRGALEGSVDGGVLIKVEPRTRVALAYYQLSTNEIGVDTGTIPVAVQGQKTTLGNENLTAKQPDPSTKVEIYVFALERLFTIHNSPLVATFAYDSQDAFVFGARKPVLSYLDGNVQNLFIRTAQHYNLLFSEPFVLDDQKLFIVFNEQIQQLVHTTGFNQAPNRPQLLYSAFFQYDINDKASFFLEPAKNVEYYPTDRFPNHEAVFVYGVTYKLKKPFFFQASVTDLTTTNPDYDGTGRIGVTRVTIACPPNTAGGTGLSATCQKNLANLTTLPTFGGTKIATINLSVGIGTPPVYIPF